MGIRGIGARGLKRRKGSNETEHLQREVGRALKKAVAGRGRKVAWKARDLTRSQRVIAFCESLMITSGEEAGKSLALRPWQRAFIEKVYSTDDTGRRLVRTAIFSMGRKNGKTQLAAALALCHLCGPESEARGEVYSCANDRAQAAKIFSEMVALILAHPALADRLNIIRHKKEIEDLESGSVYVALSSEAKTKMGLSPSFVVYDELGVSPDRNLFDAMDTAMGARREPLLLVISTQAADDNATMSSLIDYGLKVQAGEIADPTFHLTFHSAPDTMDPWSPEAWHAANPALGDFRSLADVERQAQQAQRMPSSENTFRNLVLNQRVAKHSKFIERSEWNACADEALIPYGGRVYGGLDLGSTRDMSALVLIHQDIDGVFHVLPEFWLPGDVAERTDSDRQPYDVWQRSGLLTAVGKATDPKIIALRIAELSSEYRFMTLAFDRWRINDLKRELDEIGCDVQLVGFGQGFKDMSPAVDIVERLVAQRRLRHGGNPVLQSCVSNAVITRDPAGGRKLDKAKSTGRIDGLVALAMALGLALIKTESEPDVMSMIG